MYVPSFLLLAPFLQQGATATSSDREMAANSIQKLAKHAPVIASPIVAENAPNDKRVMHPSSINTAVKSTTTPHPGGERIVLKTTLKTIARPLDPTAKANEEKRIIHPKPTITTANANEKRIIHPRPTTSAAKVNDKRVSHPSPTTTV